jgi:hypothetical protein
MHALDGARVVERVRHVCAHVTLDDKREALEKVGDLFEEDEK